MPIPAIRAATLNEPYMQVDVIDLAYIFLVPSAWYSTGLEKLHVIILASIGLLLTTVNVIETFIRG